MRRLETIFDDLGKPARGKKCLGMEGLLAEGKEMMEEDMEPEVLDAALISAAQRVEHYEIAAYGTLRTYARQLGYDNHAQLLQQSLDEEGEADKLLTPDCREHSEHRRERRRLRYGRIAKRQSRIKSAMLKDATGNVAVAEVFEFERGFVKKCHSRMAA